MVNDFYNQLNNQQFIEGHDPMKGLSFEERVRMVLKILIGTSVAIFFIICLCALFQGCTTPKVVEQHHHHHYRADTLATEAQADAHATDSRAMLDSLVRSLFAQYSASWLSNDDQKERLTETIVTTIDSLGRQTRTEQRTTEKSISRQQQQTEQRMVQELENRLRTELQERDSIWQMLYSKMQAHWDQNDSTANASKPSAEDNRPWYRRWWQSISGILIGIVLSIVIIYVYLKWKSLSKK